jgi:hypothetical protein
VRARARSWYAIWLRSAMPRRAVGLAVKPPRRDPD